MLKSTLRIYCKTLAITKEVVQHRTVMSKVRAKESFQNRVLDYFKTTSKDQQRMPFVDVNTVDDENENTIDSIFKVFHMVSSEKDSAIKESLIHKVDVQCVSLISDLKVSEIFNLMTEYLKIIDVQTFVSSYFYHKSLSILMKAAKEKQLSNHEIVELLYFVSLDKKNGASCIEYMQPLLPDLSELTLFEKCITAQSFCRTSMQLQLRQSRLLEESLERDFQELTNDPILLTTICEAIVSSTPSDDLTLNNLSKTIIESEKPFNFYTIAYILSLYSKSLLFEPKPIDKLVKFGINIIEKDIANNVKSLSIADISLFSWSISHLGVMLTLTEKLTIRKYVEERFSEFRTKENLPYLVTTLLSLHMLRTWSTKIILDCFKLQVFEPIFNFHKFHWKTVSSMQLLMSQIHLEMKMKIRSKILLKQSKVGFTPSQNVQLVQDVAFALISQGIVKDAIIECPIKTLIIPGVTIKTENETYHVDILDNLTCLKKTNIPHGLTNLKLRLLSRLRYRQILIPGQIFKEDRQKAQSDVELRIKNIIMYGKAASHFNHNKLQTASLSSKAK